MLVLMKATEIVAEDTGTINSGRGISICALNV